MPLFKLGNCLLSSGDRSLYKIECDALTDADWDCLAALIAAHINFGSVEGVPRGGLKLAERLQLHVTTGRLLIVDDVYTTGQSMEYQRAGRDAIGVCVFARGKPAAWVTPIFQMWGRVCGENQ